MRKNTIARGPVRGFSLLVAALAVGTAGPLRAQDGENPLSLGGRLRLGVAPVYLGWSSRFGSTGSESLGSDLNDPSGSSLFPGIALLEERLRELIQNPGYRAWLGSSRAEVSASRVRVPMRAEVGIFDWLTVGVTVPLVQNRTEIEFAFRADSSTANLGVNPAVTNGSEVLAFTDELNQRLSALSASAASLCGADPSSPECAAARQLEQEGQRLLTGFNSTYSASPFFPLTTSQAASDLRSRMQSFNEGLTAQGLTPVARAPLFASARVSATDFEQLLSEAGVGINTIPFANRVGPWQLGDVELHAALRLLQAGNPTAADGSGGKQLLVGGGALLRLGTGVTDDPDVFLDMPAGDGQVDMEGRIFSDVRVGRAGLWGDLRYGLQQSRTLLRRVGPADLVLIPVANRAQVEWTPGDYLDVEVMPRLSFGEVLEVNASYHLFHKQEDSFTRLSPVPDVPSTPPLPVPPLFSDVSLLAAGTAQTVHELGGGLAFSTARVNAQGRAAWPLEARIGVRWALAGSGRYAPKGVRASAGLRLFYRLWGG